MSCSLKKHHLIYIDFFEKLTSSSVSDIDALFSPNARFKDPFNDVLGIDAIRYIFEHLFETASEINFEVISAARSMTSNLQSQNDELLLIWNYSMLSSNQKIYSWQGSSRITFSVDGKVTEHIDYWDPAEAIYSRLPLIGALMNFLRKRLSTSQIISKIKARQI